METVALKHKIANSFANAIKNVPSGHFGKERFWLTYLIYHLLPWFGYDYPKLVEWKFILKNLPKDKKLRILDVGCTSSLFIYKLASFGEVFGLDSRPYGEHLPGGIKFMQGDIMKSHIQQ